MRGNGTGRTLSTHGYVLLYMPGHPLANPNDYVKEHQLVAENALGRPLPFGVLVHHADENRQNNTPSNLVVCQDRGYHNVLHRRLRAFKACGNPGARRCSYCRSYDRQNDIRVNGRGNAYHADCHRESVRKSSRSRRRAA